MPRISKVAELRKDPKVDLWWSQLNESSDTTGDPWVRCLGRFCELMEITPQELAKLSEQESFEPRCEAVRKFEKIKDKKGEPLSSGYVDGILNVKIPNWIRFNGGKSERSVKIKNNGMKKRTEITPDTRIVDHVWTAAGSDSRARVCISIVGYAGQRQKVLGNGKGTDGIVLGDMPELVWNEATVRFSVKTPMLRIRQPLSKNRKPFFTFLTHERSVVSILDHLQERKDRGEIFTTSTPLVIPTKNKKDGSPFVETRSVSKEIRKAVRDAKLGKDEYFNPNLLRNFFFDRAQKAEEKGLIIKAYHKFFGGQTSDVQEEYTLNRQRLSDEKISDLRAAFERMSPYLLETVDEQKIREAEKQAEKAKEDAAQANLKVKTLEESLPDRDARTREILEHELGADLRDVKVRLKQVESQRDTKKEDHGHTINASNNILETMLLDPKFYNEFREAYREAGERIKSDRYYQEMFRAIREGNKRVAEAWLISIVERDGLLSREMRLKLLHQSREK